MIKCDEAMRRSKEKCWTPEGRKWRCTGECKQCPCAMHKQYDASWVHTKFDRAHPRCAKEAADENNNTITTNNEEE